jgi:uncharacterized Zn finger protein (UPF0148 family)
MPRGKKICPDCNTELGVRTGTCPKCSFDFSSRKKEKEVEEREEIQDQEEKVEGPRSREARELLVHMMAHPVNIAKKMSPREHAQRVLDQGKESALSLLRLHNYGNKWSHVDWKYVAEKLGEETVPEEVEVEE